MDPIITLPVGFAGDLLAYAGQLTTDLSALITLAIGIPVGFWVLSKVIGLVRARAK